MDIKKTDPTQRLREASQESQESTQLKLYPKGFSEVPDSLEKVKQSDAFEQAIADPDPASRSEKGGALNGLRIGSDARDLVGALEDILDRIPSTGSIPAGVVNALLNRLRGIGSDSANGTTPTTSVQSERLEKLKDIGLNINERVPEARTNNPIADFVTEIRGPEVPSSPVQPGDALDGFRVGAEDDFLNVIEDALDRIPNFPGSFPQNFVNALLDRLGGNSSSDPAAGSTPTTTVRSEQINRIRTALSHIAINHNEK